MRGRNHMNMTFVIKYFRQMSPMKQHIEPVHMITNIIRKSIAAHEPIEYISSTAVLEQNYYHISILYLKGFSPSWTNLVWVFIHVCLLGFFDRAEFLLHSFLFVSNFFVSIFYHNRDNCTFLDQISHGSSSFFNPNWKLCR